MARQTDTRARVREIATQLAKSGSPPTPTLVRKLIGGGSPNTITDELRRWREENVQEGPDVGPPTLGVPAALQSYGLDELSEILKSATQSLAAIVGLQSQVLKLLEAATAERAKTELLVSRLEELATRYQHENNWMRLEVEKINDRYEGVQRHMLLSIDDARQAASRWKIDAEESRAREDAWRTSAMTQINTLQDENAYLKGRLDERDSLEKSDFNVETPPANTCAPPERGLSGEAHADSSEPPPLVGFLSIGDALLKANPEVLRERPPSSD